MINQQTQALLDKFKEDPFDIEGIDKPTMDNNTYNKLKSYLIMEIKNED